jgi:hypothetical protein
MKKFLTLMMTSTMTHAADFNIPVEIMPYVLMMYGAILYWLSIMLLNTIKSPEACTAATTVILVIGMISMVIFDAALWVMVLLSIFWFVTVLYFGFVKPRRK